MSRYVEVGLTLIVAFVIGGCGNSESETPQTPAAQPSAGTPASDPNADEALPHDTTDPIDADSPDQVGAPSAETDVTQSKPTVLSAIGQAVAGALHASEDEPLTEAPAYQPPQ